MNETCAQSADELLNKCESFINELKTHCVANMFNRQYSWRAKHPYKVMLYVNSMTWRMYDMSKAALALMKQDVITPSICLVRACWENMVATYELKTLVQDCCEQQKITETVDDILMRLLYSNRYEKDNRYVGEEYYESFKEYKAKNILTLVQKLEKDYPAAKNFYSTICEYVHPNSDGVCGSYSRLNESTNTTSFGAQFNKQSFLFSSSVTTLGASIALYLEQIEYIKNNLAEFTKLCEAFLKEKYNK